MGEFFVNFFTVFKNYLFEVVPLLAMGLLLSGLIREFAPSTWMEKLRGKGIIPILFSTISGTILPLCCFGSLPVALTFYQRGVKLGPVLAFLVATPATSITALLVCFSLLGLKFTAFILVAVILMGVIMGLIGNSIKKGFTEVKEAKDPICGMVVDTERALKLEYKGTNFYFCNPHCLKTFQSESEPEKYLIEKGSIKERTRLAFKFAFVDMVREIGPELLLGLLLASVIVSVAPIGVFIEHHLSDSLAYLLALFSGLIMYICSTASPPLVHALITQGMNVGAGMVMLIAGPITSLGTILVIKKEFGIKILLIYLISISIMSLSFGYIFSLI